MNKHHNRQPIPIIPPLRPHRPRNRKRQTILTHIGNRDRERQRRPAQILRTPRAHTSRVDLGPLLINKGDGGGEAVFTGGVGAVVDIVEFLDRVLGVEDAAVGYASGGVFDDGVVCCEGGEGEEGEEEGEDAWEWWWHGGYARGVGELVWDALGG